MSDSENQNDPNGENPKTVSRGLAVWLLIFALLALVFTLFNNMDSARKPLTLTEFYTELHKGNIAKAELLTKNGGGASLHGEFVQEEGSESKVRKVFQVTLADNEGEQQDILKQLQEYEELNQESGFKASSDHQTTGVQDMLLAILPFLLILGLLYWLFMRQMRMAGRGAMNFGKSRAKMLSKSKNKVTFKDVAGAEEAEEELQEIIDFLRDPKKFQRLGGRIPKGVLLVGPPGTGKTLLAKAIAGEADVAFFNISGSDFVEMFVGVGASRVRDMFEQGRKNAPCIIFIDEIDAVGRSRFSGIGGGHDEREQTLNAMLVEMDGFDTQEGIIIIAATNRPDVLDNALLRPGRFDRQIHVGLPSLEGREKILEIHSKNIKLDPEVDFRRIARGTPGFSGADLANLMNEAALMAARRDARAVTTEDIERARDKVAFGVERKSLVLDKDELKITAYHEAGHAITMALQEKSQPVHKVTIIPRGRALGLTMQLPTKDQYGQSKQELVAMLINFMGGRAAEEIVFGDITTGAANDILQSTRIARAMVCEFGMDPELGPQAFGENQEHLFLGREVARSQAHSEETARKIDASIHSLLSSAYATAKQMLLDNRMALDAMACALLERETIDAEDVADLLKHHRIRSPEERAASKLPTTNLEKTPPDANSGTQAPERPDVAPPSSSIAPFPPPEPA